MNDENQVEASPRDKNDVNETNMEVVLERPTICEMVSSDQDQDSDESPSLPRPSLESSILLSEQKQNDTTKPITPPEIQLSRSFSLDSDSTRLPSPIDEYKQMPYPSNIYYRKQPAKYDFTERNQISANMNCASNLTYPPTLEVEQPQGNYYVINDDQNRWPNPIGEQIPMYNNLSSMPPPPPPEYLMNNNNDLDYFYPIVCGNHTTVAPPITTGYFPENYVTPRSVALGYAPYGSQAFVVPCTNYTTLQPQNFYACMQLPPISRCQTDCMPGRMPCVPTTVSCETSTGKTAKSTQPTKPPSPTIAWENNSQCCCDVQTPVGPTPFFAHCRPPYNMGSFYCQARPRCRRTRREYYLQAPKARTRVVRDIDRCKPTTTTTPRPKTWPTNYPIKFRLQKSIDDQQGAATAMAAASQVNNLPPVSNAAADQTNKIILFGTDKGDKSQRSKSHPRGNKSVPETASSKLRKKHNEIKMQELQETLEIALEKMNHEMNE